MKLETPRLILRPFEESDAQGLYGYLSDPDVVKFEPYGVLSRAECEIEATRRASDEAFWAVTLKDGTLIGNLYFTQPDEQAGCELGYVFAAAYQGRGYATEAARKMLFYAFTQLSAHRVTAMCDPRNERSWRLMERLGMRREGVFLQNVAFERDARNRPIWKDTYQYAILANEFLQG